MGNLKKTLKIGFKTLFQCYFIYLFKFNVCDLRPVPILQRAITRQENLKKNMKKKRKTTKIIINKSYKNC
jgi:hypothetical protein